MEFLWYCVRLESELNSYMLMIEFSRNIIPEKIPDPSSILMKIFLNEISSKMGFHSVSRFSSDLIKLSKNYQHISNQFKSTNVQLYINTYLLNPKTFGIQNNHILVLVFRIGKKRRKWKSKSEKQNKKRVFIFVFL